MIRIEIKNPHVNTTSLRARVVADGRDLGQAIVLTVGQGGALKMEPGSHIIIEPFNAEQERAEAGT